jgi:hypothetical protein
MTGKEMERYYPGCRIRDWREFFLYRLTKLDQEVDSFIYKSHVATLNCESFICTFQDDIDCRGKFLRFYRL